MRHPSPIKGVFLMLTVISMQLLAGCKEQEITPDFGFSAIIVKDFDQSVNWYADVLNFELVNSNGIPERGLKQANLRFKHMKLEIIALESSVDPDTLAIEGAKPALLQGLSKTGFSISEFDKRVADWEADGIISADQVVRDPLTNKQMIILRDPDGNSIPIFDK